MDGTTTRRVAVLVATCSSFYEYISKLAPGVRVMLVPSNAPFILPLPEMERTTP